MYVFAHVYDCESPVDARMYLHEHNCAGSKRRRSAVPMMGVTYRRVQLYDARYMVPYG